ncbi:MAG: EamA family transporter [Gracilibacteraceae bacterium]|nr:EamA family transporter [Gracilibacteraceae bacterium]
MHFEQEQNRYIYVLSAVFLFALIAVIGKTVINKGISIIGADRASITATSELPITILLSFFALGEKMELVQLAGMLLIMCSIIMLQYEDILEGD